MFMYLHPCHALSHAEDESLAAPVKNLSDGRWSSRGTNLN